MATANQISFPFGSLKGSTRAPKSARARAAHALAQAPRRSAVRVPDGWEQASLVFPAASPRLFVHEGARQLLEKRLGVAMGEPVVLHVTDNRRTMISSSRKRGRLELRLHHMFLDADPFTVAALGRYVGKGDRSASAVLGVFIESRRQQIAPPRGRHRALRTSGAHHDLFPLFEELNHRYFGGMVDAKVTWGRRPAGRGRRRRQSIKLGTYCSEEKLIRVHPALDQPFVPRYFVSYILFHEMLHHVMPMPVAGGRRQFHTREFKERERTFEHYERAIRWEQRFVHRLLG